MADPQTERSMEKTGVIRLVEDLFWLGLAFITI